MQGWDLRGKIMNNEENKQLLEIASKSAKFAYAPYSKFKVGAALLTDDGIVFTGCNIENASYGLCNCAERTAIFKAVSEAKTNLKKIAVAIEDIKETVYPCGACLQVISEFMYDGSIIISKNGEPEEIKVKDMLPYNFVLDK